MRDDFDADLEPEPVIDPAEFELRKAERIADRLASAWPM